MRQPGMTWARLPGSPWQDLFPVECTIAVDATVRESGITHSHFAAQKTKDAVADRFRDAIGRRPDVNTVSPDVRIVVRIVRDAASVSLDTSGESLNRRGYRSHPAEASLKETLAAGLAAAYSDAPEGAPVTVTAEPGGSARVFRLTTPAKDRFKPWLV